MTMHTNRLIFATLLVSLLLVGCCPKPTLSISTRDSVRIQREYVERLRTDTVIIKVAREFHTQRMTKDTLSVLAHDNVLSKATISNGLLLHSLDIVSKRVAVPVTIKDTYTTRDSVRVIREHIEVPVKRPIDKFWQFFIASGILLWMIVAFKVYRYVLK